MPVLEAAHIRPYTESGPHQLSNGLLLRSDVHTLFDLGYMTVTPHYRVIVSQRIKTEFENGRDYYALHGRELANLPIRTDERPDKDFLRWHNTERYRE